MSTLTDEIREAISKQVADGNNEEAQRLAAVLGAVADHDREKDG